MPLGMARSPWRFSAERWLTQCRTDVQIERRPPFGLLGRDHDPSRIAFELGNGDFVLRAWRDHEELPDSVAEPPFADRGEPSVRRFLCNRPGLDRSTDRQKPESDSNHKGTSCKKRRHHMRQRRFDVLNSWFCVVQISQIFGPPHATLLAAGRTHSHAQ
jgi:hypothetical protein